MGNSVFRSPDEGLQLLGTPERHMMEASGNGAFLSVGGL